MSGTLGGVPIDDINATLAARVECPERERQAVATRIYQDFTAEELRDLIATERENGRAFGPIAEACRDELARKCERE